MRRNIFELIYDFNQNVLGIDPRLPLMLAGNERDWLAKVLREEAEEFETAPDLVEQVDAIVDSIVFAVGGLYRLGLSAEQAEACVNAVMEANFAKKAGQKEGRIYDGVVDAVKPKGWVGPEARIKEVIENVEG